MSPHQQSLIEILEGYAVHGEELPRRHAARELVQASSPQTRDLQRACFEMLVRSGIFDADEPLELRRAGIRTDFPVQVLEEARAAAGATARGPAREDLTHLDTFTIDDEETVDRDDALSLEVLASGYRLGVPHSGRGLASAERRAGGQGGGPAHGEPVPPGAHDTDAARRPHEGRGKPGPGRRAAGREPAGGPDRRGGRYELARGPVDDSERRRPVVRAGRRDPSVGWARVARR